MEAKDQGWSRYMGWGAVVEVEWTMEFSRLLVCQMLLELSGCNHIQSYLHIDSLNKSISMLAVKSCPGLQLQG